MVIYAYIFFFFVLTTVLFGGHYFIYSSILKFFPIYSPLKKILLLSALALLGLSFIVSTVLLQTYHTEPLRYYYVFTCTWIGIAINLLLFLLMARFLKFVFLYLKISLFLPALGATALLTAIIFSAYGFYNAQKISLTEISVEIPNLPATWKGKTAVQITDVHLGAINRRAFMEKIVTKIEEVKPDIIFLTGDLLDGTAHNHVDYIEPIKRYDPPLGTYYVTGNHETYIGVEYAESVINGADIKKMHDEIIEKNGMQIVGINYPERGMSKDLLPVLKNINREKPAILLYHEPIYRELAREHGINLQLSGHTHAGQIWPFNLFTWLIYKKYHRGLNVDGDFSIYTSSATGTWGPPMRTSGETEIVKISFY